MPMTENNEDFLNTEEHATLALFGPSSTPIKGIFENAYLTAEVGGSVPISGRTPVFYTPESYVPAPKGKLLVVGGANYTIMFSEPDGTGWTNLILEKA